MYEEGDDGRRYRRYADPIAVGDEVIVTLKGSEGTDGAVEELLPRRSKLARLLPKTSNRAPDVEQIIAANIDLVLIVAASKRPRLNLRHIDRLLILAEYGGAEPILLINKRDLLSDEERAEQDAEIQRIYGPAGLEVHFASALQPATLEPLKRRLAGAFTVLAGPSGSGKSTVLNGLHPGLGLRVGEVSEATQKGRHTTAFVQMYDLPFGGRVADAPGLREVGIWGTPTEMLDYYFKEMRPYLGQCRFGDCWHFEEPGCAVRGAAERSEISRERYQSYLRLCQEGPVEEHERRPKRLSS